VNGVDIVEVPRIQRISKQYGPRFLNRIYTIGELTYCRGRAQRLASRFAAKEAMMKALGTGIKGIPWRDIEIVRGKGKPPTIQLHRNASRRAKDLRISCIALSLSHSKEYAIASVICESLNPRTLIKHKEIVFE
jgi:holo-[acyl-carrier protein] synthase